jgi:hypothetical protein
MLISSTRKHPILYCLNALVGILIFLSLFGCKSGHEHALKFDYRTCSAMLTDDDYCFNWIDIRYRDTVRQVYVKEEDAAGSVCLCDLVDSTETGPVVFHFTLRRCGGESLIRRHLIRFESNAELFTKADSVREIMMLKF